MNLCHGEQIYLISNMQLNIKNNKCSAYTHKIQEFILNSNWWQSMKFTTTFVWLLIGHQLADAS